MRQDRDFHSYPRNATHNHHSHSHSYRSPSPPRYYYRPPTPPTRHEHYHSEGSLRPRRSISPYRRPCGCEERSSVRSCGRTERCSLSPPPSESAWSMPRHYPSSCSRSQYDHYEREPPRHGYSSHSAVEANRHAEDRRSLDTRSLARERRPERERHQVELPDGRSLATFLEVYSQEDALIYLDRRIEDDDSEDSWHWTWEDEEGPVILIPDVQLYPLPHPSFFDNISVLQYQRRLRWVASKAYYLSKLQSIAGLQNQSASATQWKSRLHPSKALRQATDAYGVPIPDTTAIELAFIPMTPHSWAREAWCLATYHFRRDLELLFYHRHPRVLDARTDQLGRTWAHLRDRLRRIWGPGIGEYPVYEEPRSLDSLDDLVRERHWVALARLLLELRVPGDVASRINSTLGGSVKSASSDIGYLVQGILDDLWSISFDTKRRITPFSHRP